MSNDNHNPLSRLLDIDFPEVKKSNWNVSHDVQTTADVGYVNVVFTDRILANTHSKLDINQASFANPTVSPLYGRYRVKYLAFWAPDRLYIPPWRDGDVMVDDDYAYPILPIPDSRPGSNFESVTGHDQPYVPPTSLLSDIGIYPAYTDANTWSPTDKPDPSCALPLLAFWDIYRHYILNPQEDLFPVRVRSYMPSYYGIAGLVPVTPPSNHLVSRANLDQFFKTVRSNYEMGNYDITNPYITYLGHAPFTTKTIGFTQSTDTQSSYSPKYIRDYGLNLQNYHYGKPLAPYGSDMFTSWVSNENVELERNSSKMTIENGILTMDQWVLASRIQNKVRKSIFKNSSFAEYIDVQYGIKPPTDLSQPMFLGAFVSDIVFNDVVSSVQQADPDSDDSMSLSHNQNLGSRAGYGRGTDDEKHNFIEFTSREPGTLMILQIITPEVFYYEGREEIFDVQNFNQEFNPAFDGVGFTPLQKSVMNFVPSLRFDPMGRLSHIASPDTYTGLAFSEYNTAIGQQPYGMRHMAKVNQLKGQMAEYGVYLGYALGRSFNYNRSTFGIENQSIDRYSSYIEPEMYTNVFRSFVQDNFQFYLNFDYLKYQPISKQFLSFHN